MNDFDGYELSDDEAGFVLESYAEAGCFNNESETEFFDEEND